MTREEKKEAILQHCSRSHCRSCKLLWVAERGKLCRGEGADIDANYAYLFGDTQDSNEIDHPTHYSGEKYECIEVMVEVFGIEATKHFCLLNAFKYLWRCGKKHETPYADIAKATWYLEKYNKLTEGAETDGEQQTESGTSGA